LHPAKLSQLLEDTTLLLVFEALLELTLFVAETLGGIQSQARAGVPLSVPEIRRLFWRLVRATQQRVERMLAWSAWRRWHPGIARYWHYKRRASP
jgi:hypothetical protein